MARRTSSRPTCPRGDGSRESSTRSSSGSAYREVRPPLFEHTPLFHKSTGEMTDIVEKEMFTVPPRGDGESFTFRPEFTRGSSA